MPFPAILFYAIRFSNVLLKQFFVQDITILLKHNLQKKEAVIMDKELMEKYKNFAQDFNSGTDKSTLCKKYEIAEKDFDAFIRFLRRKGLLLSAAKPKSFQTAHDIDFEIFGDDMQFVEIELDPHETAIAEAGAMMYMDSGIEMNTIFGDGSAQSTGVMDKIFGAGENSDRRIPLYDRLYQYRR
jgi:hypothetical protein